MRMLNTYDDRPAYSLCSYTHALVTACVTAAAMVVVPGVVAMIANVHPWTLLTQNRMRHIAEEMECLCERHSCCCVPGFSMSLTKA